MTWNVLGILDLVVAVSMGALNRLPLVLVPAYFVPLFVMLHVAALPQARRVGTLLRGA